MEKWRGRGGKERKGRWGKKGKRKRSEREKEGRGGEGNKGGGRERERGNEKDRKEFCAVVIFQEKPWSRAPCCTQRWTVCVIN